MKFQYPANQIVSIWVGEFETEEDFDCSVDDDVAALLEMDDEIEEMCEVAFEEKPLPIRKLLNGFSGWESFIDQAAQAAEKLGLTSANGALVCYHLKFDEAPPAWGGLQFLGSFLGQDIP
jgi:hypothetical protein